MGDWELHLTAIPAAFISVKGARFHASYIIIKADTWQKPRPSRYILSARALRCRGGKLLWKLRVSWVILVAVAVWRIKKRRSGLKAAVAVSEAAHHGSE